MAHACRADVVGSILRPGYLKQARDDFAAGQISPHEFKTLEDRAVDQTIALQEGAGLDIVTDGEMRRFTFMGALTETVEGVEQVPDQTTMWFDKTGKAIEHNIGIAVTGKLRQQRSITGEEYAYARSRARRPVKVTVPSPMMLFVLWSPTRSKGAYPGGAFELFSDAVSIVRAEIDELVRLGCENIQVDAPELTTLVDPGTRDWLVARGMEPERMLTEGIDLLSAVAADTPGIHFGLHLCRGNNEDRWMSQGGYDYIADAIFKRVKGYDSYLLEYDDERAGDFGPLANVPDDKRIVLGLVSSKKPQLETIEYLTSRVDAAAKYVDRERLAITSQCGFATAVPDTAISEREQENKLRLIATAARTIWS